MAHGAPGEPGADGTPAPLPPQLTKAYSHNICGVCGISRYYAGVVETECELRGEQHTWTYRDPALSVTERRAKHFDALVEALEKALPVLKDAVIAQGALPAGHPAFQGIGRLQARADQARAALDAAKEA